MEEKLQEVTLTIRSLVKHVPATESHLKILTISHFAPKGVKIVEENGKLVTYV